MIKGPMDEQISNRLSSVIALAERLRRHSNKIGKGPHAADLRLAATYLRGYAALLLTESALSCEDPRERDALIREALQLRP